MIRKITDNDIDIANKLLENFNCSVLDYIFNPFSYILLYDDKGLVVYTKIYDRIEIEYIIVESRYKRQGIGTKLLNYVIQNNPDITNITFEVRKSNDVAISFYNNLGFEQAAIRKQYYGSEDAIMMIRKFDNNE